MKASISWLKDYVDIKMPVSDLAELLTMSGLHVDFVEKKGNDWCLEFEITSNRSDCLSIIGIAREIAAITGKNLKMPAILKSKAKNTKSKIEVKILDKKLCPRYTARVITDIKVNPSPKWMQDRLLSLGLRPVNNIVDITNFVLMETGQPMHAFDLDKIKGDVYIRKAKKGEVIQTIDGIKRELKEEMLVIADDSGAIAIAGIMGGLNTEVSGETKNILLESAYFDPASVRSSSRKTGLASESSYRFERRVDPSMVLQASERAKSLMSDLAKGKIGSLIDKGSNDVSLKAIKFDPIRSNKVLGIDIPLKAQKGILKSLYFSIKGKANKLKITPPSFRGDVTNDIDITEEIARIYGYNRIPLTIPGMVGNTKLMDKDILVKKEIRRFLSSMGLDEIITYGLISSKLLELFSINKEALIYIKNPLSQEQEILTQSLLPGMVKTMNWNINRKNKNLYMFEIGKSYRKIKKKIFQEEDYLSIGICGMAQDDWLSGRRKVTFFDLKGILINLLKELGISKVKFTPTDKIGHFSTAALIKSLDSKLGTIGKLTSQVLKRFDIEEDVYALEISLQKIIELASLEKRYKPVSRFPSINRDISLIAGKDTAAESIVNTIKEINSDIIKEVILIDMYKGEQIPQGKQGFLYRIEYRDDARTLTDKEVEDLHNKVKQILSDKLGITFR